jgi:hypothetical protein
MSSGELIELPDRRIVSIRCSFRNAQLMSIRVGLCRAHRTIGEISDEDRDQRTKIIPVKELLAPARVFRLLGSDGIAP